MHHNCMFSKCNYKVLVSVCVCVCLHDNPKSNVGEVSWIFDIGYWIFNTRKFLSPAPHERSPSVMRYGLPNDTAF